MGSPAELTLNCSPCSTASSSALTNDSLWEGQLEERKKLEEHLQALEDERRKIEAFKRELPICMQLLTEAIEASKELIQECQTSAPFSGKVWTSCNYGDSSYKSTSEKPVLEEFIPLKIKENNAVDGQGTLMNVALKHDSDEKLKWMDILKQGSLQPEGEDHREQQKASAADKENSSSSNLFLHSKDRIGGAFLPFSRDKQAVFRSSTPLAPSLPELTLNSRSHEAHTLPRHEESGTPCNLARGRLKDKAEQQKEINLKTNTAGLTGGTNNSSHAVNQSQRKARRCWSPELHRRFVDALQKLGGSQVATPKQIREHMKVDGLTNDEVKSHLQKYRLHTRRPSPIPETADPHTQPLVVFGGIWVPPEYATMVAQQGPNLYNSKQPNLIPSSTTQDFYSQLNTTSKMQFESSMFYDRQQTVAAQSQCSLHELTQFSGHLCNGTYASHEAGKKKSIEEDRKSETSKCKRDEQEEGPCGAEDSHTDA